MGRRCGRLERIAQRVACLSGEPGLLTQHTFRAGECSGQRSSGEEVRVESGQRDVDGHRQVGIVTADDVVDSVLWERERQEDSENLSESVTGIRQGLQSRRKSPNVGREIVAALLDDTARHLAETTEGGQRVGYVLTLSDKNLECRRNTFERFVQGVVLCLDGRGQSIESFHRRNDVASLLVQTSDQLIELRQEVSNGIFTPTESGVEFLRDVLNLSETAAVQYHRQRRQRLFRRRVSARPLDRNQVTGFESALGLLPYRRRQLDVLRAEQAGLTDFCRRVGRQLNLGIQRHRHQSVPTLNLDVRNASHCHVIHPDGRILRQRSHVRHLDLNLVCAFAPALSAWHRHRVETVPFTTAGAECHCRGQHGNRGLASYPHQFPPPMLKSSARSLGTLVMGAPDIGPATVSG